MEHEELELAITREEVYAIVEGLSELEETMIAVKDYLLESKFQIAATG